MENRLSIALRRAQVRPDFVNLINTNFHACGLLPNDEELRGAYASYFERPELRVYAPEPAGLPALREAVAAYYDSCGVRVSPEQVVVTASASESYTHIFTGICTPPGRDAGSPRPAVLLPRPGYPLFEDVALRCGLEPRFYELDAERRWRIDEEHVASLMAGVASEGGRTAALVLISPNNPTGSIADGPTIDSLARHCASAGAVMIVDEVFSEFRFEAAGLGPLPRPMEIAPDLPVYTINGASKLLASPDLKVSWIVASGPGSEEAIESLEVEAGIYLNASPLNQHAAARLLAGAWGPRPGSAPAARIVASVAERRAIMIEGLRRLADETSGAISFVEPAGGIHLPLLIDPEQGAARRTGGGWRTLDDEELAVELLEAYSLALHPGYLYGVEERTMLVASYLSPPDVIRAGLDRLRTFFTT
ncbi:MAG: pyridoxal phosphate-dependent aminotransferase [Spirochaetota bacterium]